jgi:hypothetical protein
MEQRAKAADKKTAAAVYRSYINSMKKKTKKMDEDALNEKCWDGYKQVGMKKKGKRKVPNCVPKSKTSEGKSPHKKGTEKYRKHMAAMHASAEPKGTMIEGISYANPQFDVEWEEANRYPYLEKLGSEGWEELAKTGRAVRVTKDSVKKIGNTGADGSESLDDLEPEKVARLKQAMDSGTVEMPIVVKQPDGSLELIAGNTRLIGLISTQDEAQVWLVDASTLTEDESRTDFELDDIAPELRPAVRQAMIKFPMAKDRLSAVIRMLQQDTLKQQKNIKNINRLDTENDVQDVEIDTSEDDITSLKNKIAALEKRISSEQDITNLKNKIVDLEARIVPAKDSKVKEGVGRIVKGVNTTQDVGVNQTKIEAAKLGSKVDKDGRPPVLERGSIGVPLSSGLTVNIHPRRELKIKKSTPGRLNYENPRTNRKSKTNRGATV